MRVTNILSIFYLTGLSVCAADPPVVKVIRVPTVVKVGFNGTQADDPTNPRQFIGPSLPQKYQEPSQSLPQSQVIQPQQFPFGCSYVSIPPTNCQAPKQASQQSMNNQSSLLVNLAKYLGISGASTNPQIVSNRDFYPNNGQSMPQQPFSQQGGQDYINAISCKASEKQTGLDPYPFAGPATGSTVTILPIAPSFIRQGQCPNNIQRSSQSTSPLAASEDQASLLQGLFSLLAPKLEARFQHLSKSKGGKKKSENEKNNPSEDQKCNSKEKSKKGNPYAEYLSALKKEQASLLARQQDRLQRLEMNLAMKQSQNDFMRQLDQLKGVENKLSNEVKSFSKASSVSSRPTSNFGDSTGNQTNQSFFVSFVYYLANSFFAFSFLDFVIMSFLAGLVYYLVVQVLKIEPWQCFRISRKAPATKKAKISGRKEMLQKKAFLRTSEDSDIKFAKKLCDTISKLTKREGSVNGSKNERKSTDSLLAEYPSGNSKFPKYSLGNFKDGHTEWPHEGDTENVSDARSNGDGRISPSSTDHSKDPSVCNSRSMLKNESVPLKSFNKNMDLF